MKHLLAIGIIAALTAACGLDDLESGSKFISKTREDPNNYLSTNDIHRCFLDRNNQRVCGNHGNAYLINKVHVEDHGYPDNDQRSLRHNLTVAARVGWYQVGPCGCNGKAIHVVPDQPNPIYIACPPGTEGGCTWTPCLPNATTEVNSAINKWLAPLSVYQSRYGGIIGTDTVNVTSPADFTGGDKTTPDLTINFACSGAASAFTLPVPDPGDPICIDSGTGSCTWYRNDKGDSDSVDDVPTALPADDVEGTTVNKVSR